jgi:hypothetical protein
MSDAEKEQQPLKPAEKPQESFFGKIAKLFRPENAVLAKGHIYALDNQPVRGPGLSDIGRKLGL